MNRIGNAELHRGDALLDVGSDVERERSAHPSAHGRPDDFQTPPEALDPLIPYLRPFPVIWEPAAGKRRLVCGLLERGFGCYGTDVKDGQDFLTYMPRFDYDAIVTNPPFSLKDEFLLRAYDLGKPFAFLLPLTTLEGQTRQRLFRTRGVEIIFLPRRINFETPSGKQSGSWFMTAWFTHGLNIGQQMTFWEPPAQQYGLPF